jgi:hypothetical protein
MRLDDLARQMARPLGLRGHQRRVELVPSITMGHEIRVESTLEASTAVALDIDPNVDAYWAQPFTIRLDLLQVFATRKEALDASPRVPPRSERAEPDDVYIYTPDFQVKGSAGGVVVVECKPQGDLERMDAQLRQWRSALSAVGYPLVCVTDQEVDLPGLRFNMVCIRDASQGLSRHGYQVLDPVIKDLEQWQGPLSVGTLQTRHPEHLIQMGIAGGLLGCDLKGGVLGPSTDLWHAQGDLSHLSVFQLDL